MTDPLQQVLAAEAAARHRIESAKADFESRLRETRVEAARLKARNEQRTRKAVERVEKSSIEKAMRTIDEMDTEVSRQLNFNQKLLDKKLAQLVAQQVDQIWPPASLKTSGRPGESVSV